MKQKIDYSTSFLEFLQPEKRKVVAAITKQQCAVTIDNGNHDVMRDDLANKISHINDISYEDDCIMILGDNGYPGEIYIDFPKRGGISSNQYNCLSEILHYIKNYNYVCSQQRPGQEYEIIACGNDNIILDTKNYQDNIYELLESLKTFVDEPSYLPDEVIIGRKFDKIELKNNQNLNSYVDNIISAMENNKTDVNGNPILGPDSDYKFKGFSSYSLLVFFAILSNIMFLILGIFIIIN